MRHVTWLFLVVALCVLPLASAQAGFVLESSLGYGYQVSPELQTEETTILVAPGWGLFGLLRAELGLVAAWSAAKAGSTSDLGLQVRPMLVIDPPILPFYGRLSLVAIDPFEETRRLAYGAAVGFGASLLGLGLFAEVGALPRPQGDDTAWVVEGRAGAFFEL